MALLMDTQILTYSFLLLFFTPGVLSIFFGIWELLSNKHGSLLVCYKERGQALRSTNGPLLSSDLSPPSGSLHNPEVSIWLQTCLLRKGGHFFSGPAVFTQRCTHVPQMQSVTRVGRRLRQTHCPPIPVSISKGPARRYLQ